MSTSTRSESETSVRLAGEERLKLANQFYREYHAQCFWHSPRDLQITEELIPLVIKGLRKDGGRRGFILSGQLQTNQAVHES
jgi:hypothetical protein